MTDYGERVWEEAIALGRANATTIEMARRHCLNMQFSEWPGGGRGMAEEATGLPINSREVHCPYARGNTAGMNLEWIASDFYQEHCVGCEYRRPTGDVPNLATIVEAQRAAAQAETDARRATTEERHSEWQGRTEARRATVATADPSMVSAIDDLAMLDVAPGRNVNPDERAAAVRRLTALAERAPETFTAPVFGLMLALVDDIEITDVLAPLRHLAHRRPEFAPRVAAAALGALRRGPIVEAGRCVADLAALIPPGLDGDVVRSLVLLAGAPELNYIGRRQRGAANDPAGLRVAADSVPDDVVAVLRTMLPEPTSSSALLLPPGTAGRTSRSAPTDFERASAAAAIQALATTHPTVAEKLLEPLVRNLGVDPDDHYDLHPLAAVQRALASLLIHGLGDVPSAVLAAGRMAGSEVRDRLFGVFETAGHMLDPDDRWREPGDPQISDDRRAALTDELLTICLEAVGGAWGGDVAFSAAKLAESLLAINPARCLRHLDSLLGSFVAAVDRMDHKPTASLTVIDETPPEMRALEGISWRMSHSSIARELLDAVERLASADAVGVCRAVAQVIVNERDTDRGEDLVWRLLRLLARIGRHHGDQPSVLRAILPVLHTYMVDAELSLRAGAIDAWVEVGSNHALPSSLADMLPALLHDNYIAVIRAVLAAARRLPWSDDDRARLLMRALQVCASLDAAKHTDTLKEAMATVSALTRDHPDLRPHGEQLILDRASELDGYDLREALARRWLPAFQHSPDMAVLRLHQARDPRINDRFNPNDDEELCALLDCGSGLVGLSVRHLADAALDLAPDYPIGCAEFAEVAWRAGRPADAAEIMRAVIESTPDEPAYDKHRAIARLIADAAAFDDAAAAAGDLNQAVQPLLASMAALDVADSNLLPDVRDQARGRAAVRFLLTGVPLPAGLLFGEDAGRAIDSDPAKAARARADALFAAAENLRGSSQRVTATAHYIRMLVGLFDVAANLLKFDASELDADVQGVGAFLTAARRRATLVRAELLERWDPADPLASPLLCALDRCDNVTAGTDVQPGLSSWASLVMPMLFVRGPRRRRSRALAPSPRTETNTVEEPVVVVLASVDGQLITGPQILRPDFVYELELAVRLGEWPEWADRLDAELIGHLTDSEIETPTISWQRPSGVSNDDALIGAGSLVLRFGLATGQPAPPFLVKLRFHGALNGEPVAQLVDVAGHRELRFRPFDASRDFLTDFPVFDERLLRLYEGLHGAGYDEVQLQAFCRLFTAICRVGLRMTWDKRYKRGTKVTEKQFHDDLYLGLQAEPELSGRLERGTPLALGYLDVRHDGITAELKVERQTPVTDLTAPKYMGQPTQYAAADGARLSILAVLDMTPKLTPVGTPENYVFTLEPALHGLDNPEAPSLVAAIVVNGNLPPPSSWSRRKTPTR